MAVGYNWTWGPMKVGYVNNTPDVVTGIAWICIAIDPDFSYDIHGKESGILLAPPPDQQNFIKLSDITADIVNSWIVNGLDTAAIEATCNEYLQQQIDSIVSTVAVPDGVSNITVVAPDPLSTNATGSTL